MTLSSIDAGWRAFEAAIESLDEDNLGHFIQIRGEPHAIPQALTRSITHITYHVGQMAIVARQVYRGDWKWLTVSPGESTRFNQETWGTSSSRSILANDEE